MHTIFKFELTPQHLQNIPIPENSKILWVATQFERAWLWVEVDPESPRVIRLFSVYGTGEPIPPGNRNYIGSFMLRGGSLVFHVYEVLG